MDKLYKRDWLCLLAGTALMAIATEGFFEHARLVVGGITGIGIILDRLDKTRICPAYSALADKPSAEPSAVPLCVAQKRAAVYG